MAKLVACSCPATATQQGLLPGMVLGKVSEMPSLVVRRSSRYSIGSVITPPGITGCASLNDVYGAGMPLGLRDSDSISQSLRMQASNLLP